MPISNLNNVHLATENIAAAQQAITQLEAALAAINVNLTPDDRRKYGSVNEQNKLFVNKVSDYAGTQPGLRSAEVNWDEFSKDYSSRLLLEGLIAKLDNLGTRLKNAKVLHDYDNYQDALTDYAYTSYKAGSAASGFEDKYNALKQFFSKDRTAIETPAS